MAVFKLLNNLNSECVVSASLCLSSLFYNRMCSHL